MVENRGKTKMRNIEWRLKRIHCVSNSVTWNNMYLFHVREMIEDVCVCEKKQTHARVAQANSSRNIHCICNVIPIPPASLSSLVLAALISRSLTIHLRTWLWTSSYIQESHHEIRIIEERALFLVSCLRDPGNRMAEQKKYNVFQLFLPISIHMRRRNLTKNFIAISEQ